VETELRSSMARRWVTGGWSGATVVDPGVVFGQPKDPSPWIVG
jgi:hypothetical protein